MQSWQYFYEEVSHPEAGSPRHAALVHRLQVLQGGERRRGGELFDGGLSWRSNKQTGPDVTSSLHFHYNQSIRSDVYFLLITFSAPQHKAEAFAVFLLQQHRLLLDYIVTIDTEEEVRSSAGGTAAARSCSGINKTTPVLRSNDNTAQTSQRNKF